MNYSYYERGLHHCQNISSRRVHEQQQVRMANPMINNAIVTLQLACTDM